MKKCCSVINYKDQFLGLTKVAHKDTQIKDRQS